MANWLDVWIMSGIVHTFDKLLYPLGIRGVGTLTSGVARWRKHPLREYKFQTGGSFFYPNYDSYWSNYLLTGRPYEPDISALLRRVIAERIPFGFLDGGANFGFWSCFLAQWPHLVDPIVAIEPTPKTFEILSYNATRTSGRIQCLRAAISDVDGADVVLSIGAHHAANHLVIEATDDRLSQTAHVSSVTVDGTIAKFFRPDQLTVIKLDVEGLEAYAFAGAEEALDSGNPVIFECHGSDRECVATRAALSLGLSTYLLSGSSNPIPIAEISELCRLKTNPGMGYNLVATRPGSRFESVFLSH